jgi:hypothetical protein
LGHETRVAQHVERRFEPLVLREVRQDRGRFALPRDDDFLLAICNTADECGEVRFDLGDGEGLLPWKLRSTKKVVD